MDKRSSRPFPFFNAAMLAGAALALAAGCTNQDKPASRMPPPSTGSVAVADTKSPAKPSAPQDRGEALYAQHCAACHGAKGDGLGLAATFLFPKARDFRAGRFRLVSTSNGVPTQADLEQVLARGMPGSAMISWGHLSEADRTLLAQHVMKLRRDGARDVELALAKESDETLSDEELKAAVDRVTTPGEVLNPPAAGTATPEAIARGAALYKAKACVSCHGGKGKGDGQQKMVDAEGLPTRPRDLTLGLYKGSPDFAEVYRRLWLGMPGSPMPASAQLTPEEISDLVHFVLSLSDEATREAAVMKRVAITARRAPSLPTEPGEDAWQQIEPVRVLQTPLWWRDGAEPEVFVQAIHDGRSIALRLEWKDVTANTSAVKADEFEDMLAVELYQGEAEPFLGMGAEGVAIDLWQWRAGTWETGEADSLMDEYPFDTDIYRELAQGKPLPDFMTARVAGNPLAMRDQSAASMSAKGPGSVTFRPKVSQVVSASATRTENGWAVVLSRPLSVKSEDGLSLVSGGRTSVAFARWDGAARDRAGQKLISLWHDLRIE
jgi:mono/diheme cytochrome c family protein